MWPEREGKEAFLCFQYYCDYDNFMFLFLVANLNVYQQTHKIMITMITKTCIIRITKTNGQHGYLHHYY